MADLVTRFDAHFQRNFLACMLRDSDFLEKVARDVKPNMFADDTVQRLITATLAFYAEQQSAPDTSIFRVLDGYVIDGVLKPELRQICAVLADDLFAIPLQNKAYLLSEFEKFLRHQMFATRLPDVVECIRKAHFDEAEEKLKEVFTFRPSSANTRGTVYNDDIEARAKRRNEEDANRFWLLIPAIDRVVGGLRPGQIGVWQSQRSSAGKSTALAHCAKSFAMQGKRVLIFTFELDEQDYEDVLDQMISGLTREGLKDTTRLHTKLQGFLRHGGQIEVKALSGYDTKCSDLRAYCDTLRSVHGFNPDAIIIDTADLLAPETDSLRGDLFGSGQEVYSYWRSWMKEDKMVGWTGMQSNRDAMQAEHADQMHAGGSIAKIHIADLVFSINRTAEEEANGLTTVHVVKARKSKARFKITFPTDFSRMQFWDASRDQAWQEQIVNAS